MSLHINRYVANGITTVFPYTFVLLSEGDIAVTVGGRLLTKGSDYTISGIGSDAGGNVTITSAPADGLEIILARYITLERLIRYQSNGDMTATTLNSDFDRLWMAVRDFAASIAGSVSAAANSALIAGQHKDAAATSATNAAASATQADASKTVAQSAAQTAASNAATQTATQITQAMQGYVTSAASSATQSANSATQSADARDAAEAAAASISPADLVHKSGTETITGQKIFTTPPIGANTPGQMVATFADTPPPRTLVCNGGAVSRTLYAALFAVIGTKYGVGDGVTTFNLPNVLPSHALIAANGAGEVGTTSPGDIKSHSHNGSIGQNGDHAHTINYWVSVVSNTSTGKVMMAGSDAAQWTSTQGNHGHSISIADAGGSYNYAAGMRLLICIAY